MFALPVRSMLYPNEQLPAYTPRWDPETSSVLSSAPSYTSAAPSYHSAVPPFHTGDGDVTYASQQEARSSWYMNNNNNNNNSSSSSSSNNNNNTGNSQIHNRSIFSLNADPSTTTRSQTNGTSQQQQQQRNTSSSTRLPAPSFAPGFESRALLHGNPSDTQLRMLYNTSSWVPMNSGLQSRAYENVARRRAQQAKAEAVLLRSAGVHGGFQSMTDVSRLEHFGRQRSNSNIPAAAAAAAGPSSSSSSRDPAIAVTPSIEAARSPVSNALYGLVNASTVSVAPTLREEPVTRAATPAHRDASAEPAAHIPEEAEEGPLSPHEDPFLVGEEAATRARNQRLYITSQTQENQLHGILSSTVPSSLVPDTILGGASRPTTPFAGERSRPRRQTDAGTTSSTARTQYPSLVEQGLQARAQRSRSASTSNVASTAVSSNSSSTATTRSSRSCSVNTQPPPLTTSSTSSRSSSTSPSSSASTLLTPQTPVFRRTNTSASLTTSTSSSLLSPPAPSVKLTSTSCTNLLPVTPEADEEHIQIITPSSPPSRPRPTTARSPSPARDEGPFPLSSFLPSPPLPHHHSRRSPSPAMNDSPFASSTNLPHLRPSVTAPQARTPRSDSTDSSASESNGRVSPAQEALLIAQESKQWDFMMSQMADWEERQRTWKKFREDMERKFCSGRRLGLHGIIGWSPFHGHSKSAKKEEKSRGRKRAVSNGAQTSGSWRRRVVGRPL